MEFKRLFNSGSHLFLGKLITTFITLFNFMILSRILSKQEMGKYSLVFMIVNLLLVLSVNWSESSIVRFGREEYIKKKKINKSFWARLYIVLPISILSISLLFLFSKNVTNYLSLNNFFIVFLIVLFLLNIFINSIIRIFQSIDKFNISAYILSLQKFFYLLGLILIFFFFQKSNLFLIFTILNVSFFLSLVFFSIKFDYSLILPYKFDKNMLKSIYTYSWPQIYGFSGIYIINYIDLIVIKQFLSLDDVGVYNVAYQGFKTLIVFIFIINTLFMPLMVEYRIKKRYDLIKKYLKSIPIFTLLWTLLIIIMVSLTKYLIPILFSKEYINAVSPLNILLIASVFYFFSTCFSPIINSFDYIKSQQFTNIIMAITNIIADFLLVPRFGILGAAYGTLIACVFQSILKVFIITFILKDLRIFKKKSPNILSK